ncbi:MAG TPA: 5'-nucleotidase [Fimbriimonadaceae bacterium]|nr:5'-nucleotidase [Fimbriimonadaceae bacterium]
MTRCIFSLLLLVAAVAAMGQDSPQIGASAACQVAADALRDAAGSDCAFIAAGLLNKVYDKNNLASMFTYPKDAIVVVDLSGAEVKDALERSVSLYPEPNDGFLQLSGIEATFSKSAAPGRRIVNVTIGGLKLDDKRTYSVAMPEPLGRGDLGYFKIWDTSKIVKTLPNLTVESVLKGKHSSESPPRWSAVG